jgi:hypothetical protein
MRGKILPAAASDSAFVLITLTIRPPNPGGTAGDRRDADRYRAVLASLRLGAVPPARQDQPNGPAIAALRAGVAHACGSCRGAVHPANRLGPVRGASPGFGLWVLRASRGSFVFDDGVVARALGSPLPDGRARRAVRRAWSIWMRLYFSCVRIVTDPRLVTCAFRPTSAISPTTWL